MLIIYRYAFLISEIVLMSILAAPLISIMILFKLIESYNFLEFFCTFN